MKGLGWLMAAPDCGGCSRHQRRLAVLLLAARALVHLPVGVFGEG